MAAVGAILPALATATLATALILPRRQARIGRNSSRKGRPPLAPVFEPAIASNPSTEPGVQVSTAPVAVATSVQTQTSEADEAPPAASDFESVLSAMLDQQTTPPESPQLPLGILSENPAPAPLISRLRSTLAKVFTRKPSQRQAPVASEDSGIIEVSTLEEPLDANPANEALAKTSSTEHSAIDEPPTSTTNGESFDFEPSELNIASSDAAVSTDFAAVDVTDIDVLSSLFPTPNQSEEPLPIPARITPLPTERVVPLTRRRHRPSPATKTWPRYLVPAPVFADEAASTTFFQELCEVAGSTSAAAIEAAYREESPELRRFALRALIRIASPTSAGTFAFALRTGEDDERNLAIDGLVRIGRNDELPIAFDDRCDAIAAKAALSFVTTREREAFERRIGLFVEADRASAIVRLLDGVLS